MRDCILNSTSEELKERVYILDLLKQKSQQPKPSETVSPKLIPPTTYREEGTQIPEKDEDELESLEATNTVPVNQNNLQWTILKLKYKLIKLRIHRENLKERLSQTRFIKIKDLMDLLH